jgi:diketogulonate reductase-like aldo/keto reductase
MIDTAAAYGNEGGVGEGLKRSGIVRSEVFIQSKLWVTHYGYDGALRGFEGSLRRLGLDYIDSYILHWPVPYAFDATVEAYRALERILSEGRAKVIGVSNFSPVHLERLMERARIVPAINQIEIHPTFSQPDYRAANDKRGIVSQAWSPIGGSARRSSDTTSVDPMNHPTIRNLAEQHTKSPAQIIIRWHLQRGRSAIPKSFNPGRIADNLNVFDFELSASDLAAIDAMDLGIRTGSDPEVVGPDTFPIRVED